MNNIKDDLFYVCALIEYTARKTKNRRRAIVNALGEKGIHKQLHDACVNHCLSFEQVSDELIEEYSISESDFDTVSNCKYSVPNFQDIGRLYSILVLMCAENQEYEKEVKNIFSSFISDEISNFNTDLYYQNPDYLKCSYQAGYLLE
ncbi:MAG: hypothetical protein V3G42_12140 [Oscillospiraceae bacterium]